MLSSATSWMEWALLSLWDGRLWQQLPWVSPFLCYQRFKWVSPFLCFRHFKWVSPFLCYRHFKWVSPFLCYRHFKWVSPFLCYRRFKWVSPLKRDGHLWLFWCHNSTIDSVEKLMASAQTSSLSLVTPSISVRFYNYYPVDDSFSAVNRHGSRHANRQVYQQCPLPVHIISSFYGSSAG